MKGLPKDDDARKAAEQEASSQLKDAIDRLRKIHAVISEERQKYVDKIFEEAEKNDEPVPEIIYFPEEMDHRWGNIGYVLARACHLYPLIYIKGTDKHKEALEFALSMLQSFVWEHDTDSVYIIGGTYLGELHAAMAAHVRDPAEIEEIKKKVISTYNDYVFFFRADAFPYLQEKAFNDLAQLLTELGDRPAVYNTVWPMYIEKYPDWLEQTSYGQGYFLAGKVGIAMMENGESFKAIEMLTGVINQASLRGFTKAASYVSQQLATIIERVGAESLDIKTLLQAGKGFLVKQDYARAISYYQFVIQGLDKEFSEEYLRTLPRQQAQKLREKQEVVKREINDIAVQAFVDIAKCFDALGMKFEAIVAANTAVSDYFSTIKKAVRPDEMRTALYSASLIAYGRAKDIFDTYDGNDMMSTVVADIYFEALENLAKMNPDRTGTVNYEIAEVHKAAGRYLKAIEKYKQVPQGERRFSFAQYNICVCYIRLSGEVEDAGDQEKATQYRRQAIDSLNAVINMEIEWGVGDESKRKSWDRRKSQCFKLLASIYTSEQMYEELIPLASQWLEYYGSKLNSEDRYMDDMIEMYEDSIMAAVKTENFEAIEKLYGELKGKLLRRQAPGGRYRPQIRRAR
ncbi:MAG: hypothetical protein U5N86_03435 [Planctomycetota bacterium]|nr:hypothetical protein [Planctomycetota bacterium]